jgi:hypothetical protein
MMRPSFSFLVLQTFQEGLDPCCAPSGRRSGGLSRRLANFKASAPLEQPSCEFGGINQIAVVDPDMRNAARLDVLVDSLAAAA